MSCDHNMRVAAAAATKSGIPRIASQAAYHQGVADFNRKKQIYKEALTFLDAQSAQELIELMLLDKKPRRKRRSGGQYLAAGLATAIVLGRQKRAQRRLKRRYEKDASKNTGSNQASIIKLTSASKNSGQTH